MKTKRIVSIVTAAVIAVSAAGFSASAVDGVKIDEKNFPDNGFREYVSKKFDLDENGKLSKNEISEIKGINVRDTDVESFKGIEYFTELTELECGAKFIKELDLSENTKLMKLDCCLNSLKNLDLSKNTELTELTCSGNNIEILDLSENTKLTKLDCSSNLIKNINISNCTELVSLQCSYNKIEKLDVSGKVGLNYLDCEYNLLTELDVSDNIELTD
ncbi:MAG: hypothetical protein K2J76_06280, partial [Oscillospiraceae bacterium]|nr:hypothetical protein [Oscillospiraceae bacterium]